jgi:DNA-directed RNA polymerase specialized sigma24 family protein
MMIEKQDLNLLTDNALCKLVKKDNRDALMAIFDRYSQNLYIYLVQVVGTRVRGPQLEEDAKEILILVFESMWAKRHKWPAGIHLEDYLFTAAYQQAMEYKGPHKTKIS